MSGGTHDPFPPFGAFRASLFVTGWDTGLHDVSAGIESLSVSCCLQTLKKSKSLVKERTQSRKIGIVIPIDSLHHTSNLSFKKTLIDVAITNKVLHKLDQCDKTIFAPCDEGVEVGNAVRYDNIEFLVPYLPDIGVICDIIC